ncbi:MAG: NAD-dependent epimerase/dehydratase family protein [Saprospiraceae bacterium]|nr:NAD-dependent epimerase/dehydratase family protein [Saprospiraceae bacterium]
MPILLTGATGFLGSILNEALSRHVEVVTLGVSAGNDLVVNLALETPQLSQTFGQVVHCAGKAHSVPRNEEESRLFYAVNHEGTLRLLKGLEAAPALPRLFVFISTVAVYGLEVGENIREDYPLLGQTPYAKSKMLAEEAVLQWCAARQVRCVVLRLPLVVAPNPPGNLGAMIRAIRKGHYLAIRNNKAAKSLVQAQDVAGLVTQLCLAGTPQPEGVFNLTDGRHPAFGEVEAALEKIYGRRIRFRIPLWGARILAQTGDFLQRLGLPAPLNSNKLGKITTTLTFDDAKARRELGWKPGDGLDGLRR